MILLSVWIAVPALLLFSPNLWGLLGEDLVAQGFIYTTAMLWLYTGVGAVIFRTIQLFAIMSPQSGLVWATKILTDPFHDVKIYHKSPYHLLRGNMYDDMTDWYRPVEDTDPVGAS